MSKDLFLRIKFPDDCTTMYKTLQVDANSVTVRDVVEMCSDLFPQLTKKEDASNTLGLFVAEQHMWLNDFSTLNMYPSIEHVEYLEVKVRDRSMVIPLPTAEENLDIPLAGVRGRSGTISRMRSGTIGGTLRGLAGSKSFMGTLRGTLDNASLQQMGHTKDPLITLQQQYKQLLDNPLFSDCVIEISNEKAIHAHHAITAFRCPDFFLVDFVKMVSPLHLKNSEATTEIIRKEVTSKNIPKRITVNHTTIAFRPVFVELLRFIYSDDVNFTALGNIRFVVRLAFLASFLRLHLLQWKCYQHIKSLLSMKTVFPLLKVSDKLGQMDVKAMCIHYILDNFDQFIKQKEGLQTIGIELFQEAVLFRSNVKPVPALEERAEPPSTLVQDYKMFFESSYKADVQFAVKDKNFGVHKSILSAFHNSLAELFADAASHNGVRQLTDIDAQDFEVLLQYIYYRGTPSPSAALKLVIFANRLGMTSLQDSCEEVILNHNITNETALSTLHLVTLTTGNLFPSVERKQAAANVRLKALDFILNNLTEIDISPLRTLGIDLSVDILLAMKRRKRQQVLGNNTTIPTTTEENGQKQQQEEVVKEDVGQATHLQQLFAPMQI